MNVIYSWSSVFDRFPQSAPPPCPQKRTVAKLEARFADIKMVRVRGPIVIN